MIRTIIYTLFISMASYVIAAPPAPPYTDSQANTLPPELHYSIKSARLSAAEDNSLVLIVFFSLTDPASHQLSEQVIWNHQVRDRIGLLHTVEMEVDMGFEWTRKFEVDQIPTLLLMTPEFKIISRTSGMLDAEAFIQWVKQARRRVADGVWEGLPLNRTAGRAKNPIADAVKSLGSRDPSMRRRARATLLDHREDAVTPLIDALDDHYLGTRIAAYETLKYLAPDAPIYEPWLSQANRDKQADALTGWWADLGKLPSPQLVRQLTPAEERTLDDAIDGVFASAPVRRTRAMTILVDTGSAALPTVRNAIARAERENEYQAVLLFEDVRWAILVPDRTEADLAVRRDLARGTSEQRQAAADRLGSAGAIALPPLRELINDDDTLVRESAIHALSTVGGKDALAATATMLKAHDPNLRMVAAQQLGASGSPDAGKYLAPALNDSDEVVAIAAIAALEEAKAVKQGDVLIKALQDPRWRVRAAAAEALGKLEIRRAVPKLEKSLEDEDTFVVKSALMALKEMNAQPSVDKLLALVSRQETMRPLVIEFLLEQDNAIAVDRILTMYRDSSDPVRLDILASVMSNQSRQRNADAHWRPLMNDVMASNNPAIRRRGVEVLRVRSYSLAIEYADAALADADSEVRAQAVSMIVPLVGFHYGLTNAGEKQKNFGALGTGIATTSTTPIKTYLGGTRPVQAVVVDRVDADNPVDITLFNTPDNSDNTNATQPADNSPDQTNPIAEMHRRWYELLVEHPPQHPNPAYLFARFITGDPKAEFAAISTLVSEDRLFDPSTGMNPDLVAALLLARIPLPEGLAVVNKMADEPGGYARLLAASNRAKPQVKQVLLNPARITRILESARDDELDEILGAVVGEYNRPSLIIAMTDEQAGELVKQLVASPQPLPRATGIFISILRPGTLPPESIQPALIDDNPWVRRAAIQAYLATKPTAVQIESTLGPMIADPSPDVGAAAAAGVLAAPLRLAADLPPSDSQFVYDKTRIKRSWNSRRDTRPPHVIDRQPDFLPALKSLAETQIEDANTSDIIALTLAQYGDFSGLEKRLEVWNAGNRQEVPGILLVALLLTKDERFLEPLRQEMLQVDSEYEMRKLLNWLRGVRGTEARALRRKINVKMREMTR